MKGEGLNSYWVLVVCSFATYYLLSTTYCFSATPDLWEGFGVDRMKDRPPAPEFVLKTLDGKEVSLKDLRGKVVFLNFWATWCSPCKEEMPSIEALHKRFKGQGLVVLGVAYGEGEKRVKRFVRKNGYTFTILLDPDGSVTQLYMIIYIPVTYLIDRDGKVIGKAMGPREWDSPEAFKVIEEALRQ